MTVDKSTGPKGPEKLDGGSRQRGGGTYRSFDPDWQIIMVIYAIRDLSPPTVTFPHGKSVRIADVVRITMLSEEGIKRSTARNWITKHNGIAWKIYGNQVGLLPISLDRALLLQVDLPDEVKQSGEKLLGVAYGFVPRSAN